MAFAIMSTGSTTRPRLHTIGPGTLVAVGCMVMLMALGGGFTIGLKWRGGGTADAEGGPVAVNEPGPRNPALADRVGALAGRLIRLESEAGHLAKRVGIITPAPAAITEPAGTADPSGGPLLAPEADTSATPADPADFSAGLIRLARDMDRLEARLSAIAAASTVADLNSMAFPSRLPVPAARVTSGFGNRRDPFTGGLARHTGLDLRAPYGAPILASAGGRVRHAGYRGAYGRTVEIDHGNGLVTRYGHASKLLVKRNDIVLPGQQIALVGSTGRSTGPHLHFEVLEDGRPVAPARYLARNGR